MNFEIRESKGDWSEYPYRYGVYLDDVVVWEDDFRTVQTPKKIFHAFTTALYCHKDPTETIHNILRKR